MKSIFISSTFRDFHKERDLLRSKIIPAVNDVAKQYGEFINLCDLRWGVDTSQSEDCESKVLSVCLDEIDRSRPYMLVFLGERYGYVPGKEYIYKEAVKRNLELEDLEISVTQLEIEYGVFHNKETLEHTWFYFREVELLEAEASCMDSQEQQYQTKLASLKQRIKNLVGDRVIFYKIGPDVELSYETLCKIIEQNLITGFIEEWKMISEMTLSQKENHSHWNHIKEKAGYFTAGKSFADTILQQLEKTEEKSLFVLTGAMGTGKSTCFSYICTEMQKKDWDIIPIMCGNTALSTDETAILRHINWWLEDILKIPHMSEEEKEETFEYKVTIESEKESSLELDYRTEITKQQERLYQLCSLYEKTERKLLLAIDAIEQLLVVKDMRDLVFLPHSKGNNIKIFLTSTKQAYQIAEANYYEIPSLSDKDKNNVINKVLYHNGKQISPEVLQILFNKKESKNPLFLYLAVNNLCFMTEQDYNWIGQFENFMEGTNKRQIEMIEQFSDDLCQMSAETLRKVLGMMQSKAIEKCIEYLSVSRHGLRSMDLEQLLKKDGLSFVLLHFSQLIHSMSELYTLRLDGRYDYLHRALREGILNTLPNKKTLHRNIAEHLLSLPEEDSIRQQELYYHLIQADMDKEYIQLASGAIDKHLSEEKYVMEEMYYQCMVDHGMWLLNLVKKYLILNEEQAIPTLPKHSILSSKATYGQEEVAKQIPNVHFTVQLEERSFREEFINDILHYLYHFETAGKERFLENKSGLMEYHTILIHLVELLEQVEKDNIDERYLYHVLAIGYSQLAENFEKMDTLESLLTAGSYYDKVIQIREIQIKQNQDDFNGMELAIAYLDKGDWLNELGSDTSKAEALIVYEYALKCMKAVLEVNAEENYIRNYALLCGRIGRIYQNTESAEGIQKALEFYQEAEDILRNLIKKYNSKLNSIELVHILCKIGSVYIDLESNENIKYAITVYQEAYDLVIQAYQEIYAKDCVDELVDINYRMAWAYASLDEQSALLQAFEIYKQAFSLAYEAFEMRGFTRNCKDMIRICHGICAVSLRLAESTYLEQALEYAHMASDYARSLVFTDNTMQDILLLINSFCQEGEVYNAIGTKQALEEASQLYDETLMWAEKLQELTYQSVRVSNKFIDVLEQIGHIYEKMGGVLNLKKALPYYERVLTQTNDMVEQYGSSVERQRKMEIAYTNIGRTLLGIGERESLIKAKTYMEQALQIARHLAEEISFDKYQWDLSICYNLYAEALWELRENLDDVKKYYQQAFEIRKSLEEKQSTLASKKLLGSSYGKLIQVYSVSPNYKDKLLAANYANKQSMIYKEIMEKENTLNSKMDLANAYMLVAKQYAVLSSAELKYVLQAKKSFEKSLRLWNEIVNQIKTYRAYTNSISAYMQAAQLLIRMGEYKKAEEYYETSISLGEEFLKIEQDEEYKTLLADIYMQIGEYYASLDRLEYADKCLVLYHKAFDIYNNIELSENYKYLSNIAAICNSIAGTTMMMERYEEAILYYQRNIEFTLQIPYEERTQQGIICLYSSYNRIGAMYFELGQPELGIPYFKKAIESEEEALNNIKEAQAVPEMVEDSLRDVLFLADAYDSMNELDFAVEYYDKGIYFLNMMLTIYEGDRTYEKYLVEVCIKQMQIKFAQNDIKNAWPYCELILGYLKKYPEYEPLFHELETKFGLQVLKKEVVKKEDKEELLEMYSKAEYYFTTGKQELALQIFQEFLDILENIPREELCDQVIIYEYNIYNYMAVYYANKNTEDSYMSAMNYYEITIQKELDALERVSEDRIQEVMNDICEDCSHVIALCYRMEKYEKISAFYDLSISILMVLGKNYSEDYEILLARQAMDYVVFKKNIIHDEEMVEDLLLMIHTLSQKHVELSDLQNK